MSGARPCRVDHVALAVSRLAWHVALFDEVFGMAVTAEDLGEPRQVWLDGGIQLIERRSAPVIGGVLAHVAIGVEDQARVAAGLARNGCVELEHGPSWWALGEGLVVELVDAPR